MKIEVSNKPLAIYILYILFIWFCECIDLLCFLTSLPQQTFFSRVVALFFVAFLIFSVREKVCLAKEKKYSITKIITIIFIIMLGLVKSCYPDTSYDVGNYHLIAQSNDFVHYFESGFGGGNFQIWGFRLGDRLFNPFVQILGYRYGTVLNLLVIILLYIQVSNLIDSFFEEKIRNVKAFNPYILAFIVVFVHDSAMEMASYNVDLLAIPLCIEMLSICVNKSNGTHEYFAFLAGMALTLKMTNIVYIIPLLLVYIVKNIKRIKGTDWIMCFIMVIVPFSIYTIYNFTCTGNPIFPYMNSIFKSRYFHASNFRDVRWGPTDIKETCLWIFYHVLFPKYRQSEIPNLYTLGILVGLIVLQMCAIICVKKVIKKEKIDFPIEIYAVFIFSSFLWSITTGHSRYFIMGDILLLIILFTSIVRFLNIKLIKYGFPIILCFMVLFSCMEIKDIFNGREWATRKVDGESISNQWKYILRDQPEVFEYKDDIDAFFLTESYYGGFAFLSNKDAPIFNVAYSEYLEAENYDLYEKSFSLIMNAENIYDVKFKTFNDWETYENALKKYGLEIADKNVVNNGGIGIVYIRLQRTLA